MSDGFYAEWSRDGLQYHYVVPRTFDAGGSRSGVVEVTAPAFLSLSPNAYNKWAQRLVTKCRKWTPGKFLMSEGDVRLFQASVQANLGSVLLDITPGIPIAKVQQSLTILQSFVNERTKDLESARRREHNKNAQPVKMHVRAVLTQFVRWRVRAFLDNQDPATEEALTSQVLEIFMQLEGRMVEPLVAYLSYFAGYGQAPTNVFRQIINILKTYDNAIRPVLEQSRAVARATRKAARSHVPPASTAGGASPAQTPRCPLCHAPRMEVGDQGRGL